MQIPILETPRLRLRGHRPEDFEECARMWGNTSVTKYIGGQPFSREAVWARLLRYAGHWSWLGYGFWLIEEIHTGRFVGEAGLADFKRNIEATSVCPPEAGWALAPHAQGRGFATEALKGVTSWHDQYRGPKTISCVINPNNIASIRVATKCGFHEETHGSYKGHPTTLFVRPA